MLAELNEEERKSTCCSCTRSRAGQSQVLKMQTRKKAGPDASRRFGGREVARECRKGQVVELAGLALVAVAVVAVSGWWVAGHRVFGRPTAEAEKKSPKNEPPPSR
jgi:hypothetical protein